MWYDLWEGKSNILMSRYAVPIGSNIFRNINIFTRKAFSFSLVQKRFQEDPIGVGELILFLSYPIIHAKLKELVTPTGKPLRKLDV